MTAYRPSRDEFRRSITFEHSSLGMISGTLVPDDKVVQFHGIPYAKVTARFRQCTLLDDLDNTDRDFKFPGPACPHMFTMEDVHSGGLYPKEACIEADEFKCLTVTLSVPYRNLDNLIAYEEDSNMKHKKPEKIPVMAYIHGGAFHAGKADAVHDTAAMVAQSIDDGQPVVMVSIQYRIGALGFLATPDAQVNLGLYDQNTALEWIQQFVGGFGGDEGKVTLMGESAGGYSICYHMLGWPRTTPLFNRVIIMSGVLGPLMVPVTRAEAHEAFEEMCAILGIEEQGQAAREKMSVLPVDELVKAGDLWVGKGNFWRPVIDASFFSHKQITWDTIPSLLGQCEWVESLIVGNTGFEGTPYLSIARSLTPSKFRSHMLAGLSEKATAKILATYNVTSATMDQNLFIHAATRWLGDIIFDAPIHALCKYLSTKTDKKVYRYIFDVGNPFVGTPFYKIPHHWVDVYFLFRTLKFRYPSKQLKDISDKHAQMWVSFANRKVPWGEYGDREDQKKIIMVADEKEGWKQWSLEDDEARSGRNFNTLDELWAAWMEKNGEGWLPLRLTELMGGP